MTIRCAIRNSNPPRAHLEHKEGNNGGVHRGATIHLKALMGKGSLGILNAVREIERKLPFALRGIDSDNGSEFINSHLLTFCQQRSGGRATMIGQKAQIRRPSEV